ncbi:sensor histidine kinase [Catelliglobosispora koreensis]|uniref:sensor histidine kinase n=1 Tax=Catelliglobosispora koreensis TaxID=129052 RepID=UPI0009FBD8E7|nr:nitrate- and nitrite sensing domain-containing protein [Catelliglobosispora koreensis]
MTSRRQPERFAIASHRRPSVLRPRDWRMRRKLATVVLIPLLAFLVVAGVQITTAVGTASDLDKFAQRVATARQITALIHELQRERDRTAGMLATLGMPGGSRDTASLAPDWTAVDRAQEALQQVEAQLTNDSVQAKAYALATAQLAELGHIRDGAAKGWLRRQAAFDMYTRTIASLHALLPVPADVAGDPALGQTVRGLTSLALVKELTAQIRGRLFIVCSAAGFEPGEFEDVVDVRAQQQAATERFRREASVEQLARFDDTVTGQAVRNAGRLRQTVIGNSAVTELGVDAQQWWLASTTELELIRAVEENLISTAAQAVADASVSQWHNTHLGIVATLALLLAAVSVSAVVGRTIARTLRLLRKQALEVAQQKLPQMIEQLSHSSGKAPPYRVDPIAVGTRDEIGEVADAFTAVHRSAVRLAVEQAIMRHTLNEIFVKLARRSQALVERQLRLLDTMEAGETDPDQLANLFRLDHLATRMRRNDENLLVLAGSDSSRRWNQAVELNTIVFAATAEIEQYPRVRQDVMQTIHIVGYAVTDLVHLTAELLENAAAFSSPETTVEVKGSSTADGGAELLISDHGFGMSRDIIAEANRQLAEPMSINISAAERMGLVVVGNLARRHGIHVELTSHSDGITARVAIPPRLIAPAPAVPVEETEPAKWLRSSGTAEETVAPARKTVAIRAEDVLGPARPGAPSIWWSRDAAAQRKASAPSPVTAQPASVVTTAAGLPKRVRATQPSVTIELVPASAPPASSLPDIEPDEAGGMLSRLYSGVRRAQEEDSTLTH